MFSLIHILFSSGSYQYKWLQLWGWKALKASCPHFLLDHSSSNWMDKCVSQSDKYIIINKKTSTRKTELKRLMKSPTLWVNPWSNTLSCKTSTLPPMLSHKKTQQPFKKTGVVTFNWYVSPRKDNSRNAQGFITDCSVFTFSILGVPASLPDFLFF